MCSFRLAACVILSAASPSFSHRTLCHDKLSSVTELGSILHDENNYNCGHMQGDDGAAVVEFPQKVKGTRDFILVDEEIQV